jgi:hypothetical protein
LLVVLVVVMPKAILSEAQVVAVQVVCVAQSRQLAAAVL